MNVTLFTLVRGLLLAAPSGVAEPSRLVRITRMTDASNSGSWSYPDYLILRCPGCDAAHGTVFRPDDDREGAPPVVVLSHEFWRRRFAGDPCVVGRALTLDGTARRATRVDPMEALRYE